MEVDELFGRRLTTTINVAVSPRLRELVRKRARTLDMSISEYVRWLIREDLKRAGLLDGDED